MKNDFNDIAFLILFGIIDEKDRMKRKAIILAAGESKRLRPLTYAIPKILIHLNGETILDYQVRTLLSFGIDGILIVVGYKSYQIKEYVRKKYDSCNIKFVENELFNVTDNAYSLELALQSINLNEDTIIILDGDIIYHPSLLETLMTSKDPNALISDNSKKVESEDCKIKIIDGYVYDIGKRVDGDAVYTSMIKMSGELLLEVAVELSKKRETKEWYSEPLSRVLMRKTKILHNIPTDGLPRCEIDTYEDLINARKIYEMISLK